MEYNRRVDNRRGIDIGLIGYRSFWILLVYQAGPHREMTDMMLLTEDGAQRKMIAFGGWTVISESQDGQ